MFCRLTIQCLIILCILVNTWSIFDLAGNHSDYWKLETWSATTTYLFRLLQAGVGLTVLGLAAYRFKELSGVGSKPCQWMHFRLFFVFLFVAVLLTSIIHWLQILDGYPFLQKSLNNSILVLFMGLWAILVLLSERILIFQNSGSKSWEIFLFNIAVTLFALEAVLTQLSKINPNPLLWDQSSIESRINAHKLKPGMDFYNTKTNRQGYHDQEFYRAEANDYVIALLADSFGVGIVPYDYNFATIAETRIRENLGDQFERVAIHNFGIAGTGIDDYAYLLENEVLDYDPNLVLVSVFIGNDLIDSKPERRNYYDLKNWITVQLPTRIITLLRESDRDESNVTRIGQTQYTSDEVPEHIFDWSKEKPSMSLEKFLAYESARLEIANTKDPDIEEIYDHFFKLVSYFQSSLGDDLVFILVPDEFQVNDSLYQTILEQKSTQEIYVRDYPQQKITSYFSDNRIRYLDLLPQMRKANSVERTYHLQNTHWNARGNEVAGNAIADYLLKNVINK